MDKEKTSKETPTQKKSASGIWEWILWILFLVLPVAVFVGVFGNTIWYALKMMPPKDDKMMSMAIPEGTILGGMPAEKPEGTISGGRLVPSDIREQDQHTTGSWQ